MKFTTREDIEAPIEHVFAAVTDFDGFERQALRRGAEVTRKDTMGKPGVGSEWNLKFTFRGKRREVDARIAKFDMPNGLPQTAARAGWTRLCRSICWPCRRIARGCRSLSI